MKLQLTLLTLLGLTAAGASAQTALKGSFELPVQAYWNNTSLPAGEYKLSVVMESPQLSLISVRGEGVATTFLAYAGGREETSSTSVLRLESVNGAYVIRQLDSSILRRLYKFPASKSARETALSGTASPAMVVPVSSGSGF
ncbi:MAG TPA: hypothetical protein VMG35_20065 [Bryobacteraceae bacterium]|nr:hypothetical protein [Bryobacteraceae bacterium]